MNFFFMFSNYNFFFLKKSSKNKIKCLLLVLVRLNCLINLKKIIQKIKFLFGQMF